MAQLTLRPHHLLCIPHFKGKGYDAAFTANLTAVTALLAAEPHMRITLTCGCDDLCKVCPHNHDGVCDSQEKVTALDRAVLAACPFPLNQPQDWAALSEAVREKILQTVMFQQICASCEWFALYNTINQKEFSL